MNLTLDQLEISKNLEIDNAPIIQSAIDKIFKDGGGSLIVPAGLKIMAGPFELKSHVHIHLGANSEIIANPDESVYNRSAFKENRGEGTVWIYAKDAENISIDGTGSLNGNDTAFLGEDLGHSYEIKPFTDVDLRPHLMLLEGCTNVSIRDITFKRSCYWCLHLAGCNDVSVLGVRILNSLKVRNSDGIDIDHSSHIRISDCYIESGDDCICLKNRREYEEYGDCENIVVSNCVMKSTSCSFKIGSENVNRIHNVLVNNCIITQSNRGIGIQNRDEGSVVNVRFQNCIVESRLFHDVWWGKSEPIYITAFPRAAGDNVDQNWRFAPGQNEGKVGKVRDIYFSNMTLAGENGIYIAGVPGKVNNISIENTHLKINKITKYPGGFYDNRPCKGKGIYKHSIHGIYMENTCRVSISGFKLDWGDNIPKYYGSLVMGRNVDELTIIHLEGTPAPTEKDVDEEKIILIDCENTKISDC